MKKIFFSIAIVAALSLFGCSELANLAAPSYTSVTVKAVTLLDFPSKQPNGFSWDPLGGKPDIYFMFPDKIKRILRKDVPLNTSVTWELKQSYVIQNLQSFQTLTFYDEDDGVNVGKDDLIGQVSFNPNDYLGQASVRLLSSPIAVQLILVWK